MLWLGLRLLLLIGAANITQILASAGLGDAGAHRLTAVSASSTVGPGWVRPTRSAASLPPCSSRGAEGHPVYPVRVSEFFREQA